MSQAFSTKHGDFSYKYCFLPSALCRSVVWHATLASSNQHPFSYRRTTSVLCRWVSNAPVVSFLCLLRTRPLGAIENKEARSEVSFPGVPLLGTTHLPRTRRVVQKGQGNEFFLVDKFLENSLWNLRFLFSQVIGLMEEKVWRHAV